MQYHEGWISYSKWSITVNTLCLLPASIGFPQRTQTSLWALSLPMWGYWYCIPSLSLSLSLCFVNSAFALCLCVSFPFSLFAITTQMLRICYRTSGDQEKGLGVALFPRDPLSTPYSLLCVTIILQKEKRKKYFFLAICEKLIKTAQEQTKLFLWGPHSESSHNFPLVLIVEIN